MRNLSCQCIDRFWAKPEAFRRIVKNSEAQKKPSQECVYIIDDYHLSQMVERQYSIHVLQPACPG